MENLPIEQLTNSVVAFLRTADPGAVAVILVLLSVALRSVWIPFQGRVTTLSILALVLSPVITSVFTVEPDAIWNTRVFWRATLQNAGVAVILWHLLLPRFLKRWPLHAEHPLPPD